MTVKLKEAKRKTASEGAIEALRDYIVNSNLKKGDSLPTEHELTASLNVSRSVIREALRHFRTLGIIETSPKKGMRILGLVPDKPFDAYMPYIKADKEKLDELFQIRMIIEIGMIPFLMEKAKEEDLTKLEGLALSMGNSDMKIRKEADKRFHIALLDIVGNDMLASIQPLMEYFDFFEKPKMNSIKNKTSKQVSQEHMDIVKALRDKDTAKLQDIFRNKHYSKL